MHLCDPGSHRSLSSLLVLLLLLLLPLQLDFIFLYPLDIVFPAPSEGATCEQSRKELDGLASEAAD